jgi:hypothetical protein
LEYFGLWIFVLEVEYAKRGGWLSDRHGSVLTGHTTYAINSGLLLP